MPVMMPHQISSGTFAASLHALNASMELQKLQRSTSIVTTYSGNVVKPAIRYIDCGCRQRGEDLGSVLHPFDWPLMLM